MGLVQRQLYFKSIDVTWEYMKKTATRHMSPDTSLLADEFMQVEGSVNHTTQKRDKSTQSRRYPEVPFNPPSITKHDTFLIATIEVTIQR